jgi:predicted transcriptional regulator
MASNSMDTPPNRELIELSVEIVSAYVGRNVPPARDLPSLIANVHAALEPCPAVLRQDGGWSVER